PPPVAPPATFKEAALWQRAAGLAAAPVPDAWWQLFRDPMLDDLESRLVIGNENLKFAVAQVAAARAQLAASRAALWPNVNATATATRSGVGGGSSASTALSQRGVESSVSLAAGASWEVDLWGRLSQGVSAAQARFEASRDDLAAARLSASATLAQSYLALRAAEAQGALIERSVAAYQRSLQLTQDRYQAGVAARSDVLQAQTQLKTAQAQGLEAAAQRAQLEHAIALLLGQPPSALTLAPSATLPDPPAVPALLPATLLERRPDIAAAERRVAAAYADIGVADAAFFPALTLSASAGLRGGSIAEVLNAPARVWSLGPALAQTLFDAGARRAASDQARANADQAASTYRQTVLLALQEVEDNLALAARLHDEAALQHEALDAAERNLAIVLDQYRAGTVSFLDVAAAQTAALTSERSWIDLRNRELAAINQLLKNIAGRWQGG
ncbi:MAG: efflux transporter outer membrane subunit, partial [Betaproteobacteria bacterium]